MTLGTQKPPGRDPKATPRRRKQSWEPKSQLGGTQKRPWEDTEVPQGDPKASGVGQKPPGGGHGGHPNLFEVVDGERQVLQGEEDLLQEGDVVGGFGTGEPRVEQLVTPDPDKSGRKREKIHQDQARTGCVPQFPLAWTPPDPLLAALTSPGSPAPASAARCSGRCSDSPSSASPSLSWLTRNEASGPPPSHCGDT